MLTHCQTCGQEVTAAGCACKASGDKPRCSVCGNPATVCACKLLLAVSSRPTLLGLDYHTLYPGHLWHFDDKTWMVTSDAGVRRGLTCLNTGAHETFEAGIQLAQRLLVQEATYVGTLRK